MKNLITLITLIACIQFSFAQDNTKEVISKAVEDMGLMLYNPSGDNDLLVGQVKRQIFKELQASSELSPSEVIRLLILETQKENKDHALRASQAYERLAACEEALGEDKTRESIYLAKYNENKIDPIQEGLSGKSQQLTAEVFVQGSLVRKYTEYVLKSATCMEKLKQLVKKAKQENNCDNDSTNNISSSQGSVKRQ